MTGDARLLVPGSDPDELWPSLGGGVCDFIEERLVHGPGDVLGSPVKLTDEYRLFLWRAYEVYPRGHELEGRRRFKRVVLSRRKGSAKTEVGAFVAIVEMDPEGPVRFDGWDAGGDPVGRPVLDPYIPMVAVTEEQVEDLAYGAVHAILSHDQCGLVDDYDVGLERIMHKTAAGKMQPLANAPSARDGARTTFQHFDEPHLYVSDRLRKSHATMMRNLPKRYAADPWALETGTMYGPGEDSVAERSHRYALDVRAGKIVDPTLYFDHRQASERWDLDVVEQLEAAVREASGDAIEWADVPSIMGMFRDPSADENELRRYWLNQPRRRSEKWTAVTNVWGDRARPGRAVEGGSKIVAMFDGSYSRDSTALIGCTVEEVPHVFEIRTWERPAHQPGWRTPRNEVIDEIAATMRTFEVVELSCDPPGWHREIEDLEHTYDVVVRFETNQPSRMGPATDSFEQAVAAGEVTHDGSETIARHLDNCVPKLSRGHKVVTKEHADSPNKIDAAIGAIGAHDRACWRFSNQPAGDAFFGFAAV